MVVTARWHSAYHERIQLISRWMLGKPIPITLHYSADPSESAAALFEIPLPPSPTPTPVFESARHPI